VDLTFATHLAAGSRSASTPESLHLHRTSPRQRASLETLQSTLGKPFELSDERANEIENHLGRNSQSARGKQGETKLMHTSREAVLENVRRYRAIASLYRQTAGFRPDQRCSLLSQAQGMGKSGADRTWILLHGRCAGLWSTFPRRRKCRRAMGDDGRCL